MKEKIIKKSIEMFTQKGYKSTSLIEIAKELNITKGGIYHYFNSKDDILFEVFDIILNSMYMPIIESDLDNMSLKEFMRLILELPYDSYGFDNGLKKKSSYDFFIYCIKNFPDLKNKIEKLYQDMTKIIFNIIKNDQTKGLIRKNIDINQITFEIIALIEGCFLINELYAKIDLKYRMNKAFERFYNSISK